MMIQVNQHIPEFRIIPYPNKKPRSKKRRVQRKYIKNRRKWEHNHTYMVAYKIGDVVIVHPNVMNQVTEKLPGVKIVDIKNNNLFMPITNWHKRLEHFRNYGGTT